MCRVGKNGNNTIFLLYSSMCIHIFNTLTYCYKFRIKQCKYTDWSAYTKWSYVTMAVVATVVLDASLYGGSAWYIWSRWTRWFSKRKLSPTIQLFLGCICSPDRWWRHYCSRCLSYRSSWSRSLIQYSPCWFVALKTSTELIHHNCQFIYKVKMPLEQK